MIKKTSKARGIKDANLKREKEVLGEIESRSQTPRKYREEEDVQDKNKQQEVHQNLENDSKQCDQDGLSSLEERM